MAYITEFTVHGLAGRDVVVSRKLDRHVNIFWGSNGTGKTSLLKILHAALENSVAALEAVPFRSAEVVFWSENHEALIQRTYVLADTDSEQAEEYVVEVQPDGSVMGVGIESQAGKWNTKVVSGEMPTSRQEVPFGTLIYQSRV